MTRRLLVSYIGLVAVLLAVLEIPLGVLALHHERGLAAQAAEREASGLAVFASEDLESGRRADLTTLVDRYQQETGGEVAVVGTSGRVVAESDADADSDARGDQKGAVEAALGGHPVDGFGSDEERPWAFAAVPVSDAGQPGGAVLLGSPAEATIDRVHDIWLALGAFGAGLLLLTTLVGMWLARSLARPLERLEATVSAFADGDLGIRATEQGPGEMRDLAAQFNLMASRLSDLVQAQTRFVADASHQLRSPLTALRLRLENLEAAAEDGATAGIAAAGREVQRLSRVVDGLLALSRADAQAPERRTVDVGSVLEERCQSWSALAEERQIVLEGPGDHPQPAVAVLVPGDLDQMLDNLIANALDVLEPGGRVAVRMEDDGRHIAVHVVDDGPGMSDGDRVRAFDRFWQGSGVRGGHSGLGLAIVRQLATRNGARADLRPARPRGLDAVILIPQPTAGQSAQQNLKDRQNLRS